MKKKKKKHGLPVGKKEKSAGEASQEIIWGDHCWARFVCRYFTYFFFLPFFPTAEPDPRLHFWWLLTGGSTPLSWWEMEIKG